jgi:putative ribosome biogenesis GTPase RsgA
MEQLTTIQQINSQIMFGSFTNEQLESILCAVKFRRGQISKETKRSLMVGDVVKFTHPKTGRTHQGNVVKIAIKNIKVRENNTTWNVPANLLTVAE